MQVYDIETVYDTVNEVSSISEILQTYMAETTYETLVAKRRQIKNMLSVNIEKEKNKTIIMENLNKLNSGNIDKIYKTLTEINYENLNDYRSLITLLYNKLLYGKISDKDIYCKLCERLAGFTFVHNGEQHVFDVLMNTYIGFEYKKIGILNEDNLDRFKQILSVVVATYNVGIITLERIQIILNSLKEKIMFREDADINVSILYVDALCSFLDDFTFDEKLYIASEKIDEWLAGQKELYGKKMPYRYRIKIDDVLGKIKYSM